MGRTKVTVGIEKIIDLYKSGKSLEEIGKIFGVSRQAVHQKLQRAGFAIMDAKKSLKIKKNKTWKLLADEVLIESCNRKVKEIWDKKRLAEMKLLNIKNLRVGLINNFKNTLNEVLSLCELSLGHERTQRIALKEISEVVKEQLKALENCRNIINEEV